MGGPNEQTVNNPVAIATRSGRVHLIYCVEYTRCFAIHSDDDGQTWSFQSKSRQLLTLSVNTSTGRRSRPGLGMGSSYRIVD